MIVQFAALTSAFAIGVLAATVGVIAALVCLLHSLDLPDGEDEDGPSGGSGVDRGPDRPSDGGPPPEWWPEFESEFAEYSARATAASAR